MKKLLLLALTNLSFAAYSYELDDISLITPTSYKLDSSFGATVVSKFSAQAANAFSVDIEKKVQARVEPRRKDLNAYFPNPGELDSFVKKIVQQGIKTHLAVVNDDNLTTFYKYLGNELVGKIAERILEKEGVSDSARRKLWSNKLTYPFNNCMVGAMNFQTDASKCLDALIDSLVPSAGIGIVYELSKANLNSSIEEKDRYDFNVKQTERYKNCLPSDKVATGADVKGCALSAMKEGVLFATNIALTKKIQSKASSPNEAKAIKTAVWINFSTCTNKVGSDQSVKTSYTTQFMDCIDNLVAVTGAFLVEDKIEKTPALIKAIESVELKKLSSEKSKQFRKCADSQKSKGLRENGMLDIEICERQITNEVTFKVVNNILETTAEKTLKSNNKSAQKASADSKFILNTCWNNLQTATQRESCLKKTILSSSSNLSSLKLDASIPDNMPTKSELKKTSVANFVTCVENNLPENISESQDLTQRLDTCTGKLTRSVALKVADHLIRETARGNLNETQTNSLIETLVSKEFSTCIGELPSDEILASCSNALSRKAAIQISDVSFSKEVFSYIEKAGGLSKLGLAKSDANQFLLSLNSTNKICINSALKDPVMDQINKCIKTSIKSIASYFGEAQLKLSTGKLYENRENEKALLEMRFRRTINECLSTKDSNEFSISDFTKNLYVCSEQVAYSTTLEVGLDQVETALKSYIKDRPNLNLSTKREMLKSEIMGNFTGCLKTSSPSNSCIDDLKREATTKIVLNYGKLETKIQLNADQMPSALLETEKVFSKCTDSKLIGDELSVHLDKCTKNYALSFAKVLGNLKMHYLMMKTLGTLDYNANKNQIDQAVENYNQCLKKLESIEMKDGLTTRLTTCTDKLTADGMNLVRSSIANWMSSEEKDLAVTNIKKQFADFIPCLSPLLPPSPYSPELASNINSSVKPIAKLLAQYIDYNPKNAKQTLTGVIQTLAVDLTDITQSTQAKKDLIDFLYTSGALDELLKGVVRGTVKEAFVNISEKDVPISMRELLLRKENFESVFNGPDGKKINLLVMEKILRPILLENIDTNGEVYKSNYQGIKDNIVQLLADAPSFGEQAMVLGVQKQINEMSNLKKFFAKKLYGEESLEWEKVRTTSEGKKAEAYIKQYILLPKFKGTIISPEEQKKINLEAENLVSSAVKNYRR